MLKLVLKPIELRDERVVESLLDQLRTYSMRVDGVPKVKGSAQRVLTAVPPGCAPTSKHVFAVMQDAEPIGLVDLIEGYPETSTAFIGLLAIREASQHKGFGRAAYGLLEQFAREHLKADRIRLAVVSTNPVGGFWERMGFTETGEVKSYAGEARTSKAILMEKRIDMT